MSMNEFQSKALDKLENELKSGKFDRYANVMKKAVSEALADFVRQDAEFAQAVVQGGTFEDCMKEVAKGVSGGISDLDAYGRAVSFYFPGATIQFKMTIDLCGSVRTEEKPEGLILDLAAFL